MSHTKFYEVTAKTNAGIGLKLQDHLVKVFNAKHSISKRKDVYRFSVSSDVNDDYVTFLNCLSAPDKKKMKVTITTDLSAEKSYNELFE